MASELVQKYSTRPEVLDGLLQWAQNPTSMSAGYGTEDNYHHIESNLATRYGQATAKDVMGVLRKDAERLAIEAQNDIYQARSSMLRALEDSTVLEEHFQKMYSKLTDLEKQVIGTLSKLNLNEQFLGYDEHDSLIRTDFGKKMAAYVRALGVDYPPEKIESLLIKSGLVSRLLWITAKRYRHIQLVVPYYVKEISAEISKLSPPAQTYPIAELIAKLRSARARASMKHISYSAQEI